MLLFVSVSRGHVAVMSVVPPVRVMTGNCSSSPFPMSWTVAPVWRRASIPVVEFTPAHPFTPRTVSTTATSSSPAVQVHKAPTSFPNSAGSVPLAGVYESAPVRTE